VIKDERVLSCADGSGQSLPSTRAKDQLSPGDEHLIRQALADQTEHLDALASQVDYLTRRESNLQALLADAHAQLVDRDREIERLRHGWLSQFRVVLEDRRLLAEQVTAVRAAHASLLAQLEEIRHRYAELLDQIEPRPARHALSDDNRAAESPGEP
jgi:chromosome segregation ATPase